MTQYKKFPVDKRQETRTGSNHLGDLEQERCERQTSFLPQEKPERPGTSHLASPQLLAYRGKKEGPQENKTTQEKISKGPAASPVLHLS